jgi:large subunit ribosomal protein L22
MEKTITAKLKYLRIPSRKTRAVADVLRGLSVNEAEARLMLSPRRPAHDLLKLLKSAIANAKVQKIETAHLRIKEIRVDQGPKTRRWTPRARGSASTIEKKTSHVTLILEVSEKTKPAKFTIIEKTKKEKEKEKEAKKETREKSHKEEENKGGEVRPANQPKSFRKVFRRKSI